MAGASGSRLNYIVLKIAALSTKMCPNNQGSTV